MDDDVVGGLDWEELFDQYDFDDCCEEAFVRFMTTAADFLAGDDIDGDLRQAARHLHHGPVLPAVLDALLDEVVPDAAVMAFVDALVAGAGRHTASPLVLRARLRLAWGDVAAAETDLVEAVRREPDWPPACGELAELTSIRGDATGTVRLLRAAGLPPDNDAIAFYEPFVARAPATVGRNEPCPCGSGRKFKHCHQDEAVTVPLERRTAWLIRKVAAQVSASTKVIELATVASMPWAESAEGFDRIVELARDPFLLDVAVVEGGGLVDFLDDFGPMLPEDERALAEVWATTSRRLWEVTDVDPGASLTLRDTGSGDTVLVTERAGSQGAEVGDLFLGVVVPVGDEHQYVCSPLHIGLRLRDGVLDLLDADADADADAFELAEWYGWMLAPPTLLTREGEAMVPRRVRVRPGVPWERFAAGVEEHFERDDGDIDDEGDDESTERWLELHDLDGEPIIRAFLRRDGTELVVDTNAEERWERIEAVLRSIDPGLIAVDETIDVDRGDLRVPVAPGPEVEAALQDHIRTAETRWLDEEIPALGGLTPRQAAEDPTRREDLVALLRSTPAVEEPGVVGFDADRLRAALGLTDTGSP